MEQNGEVVGLISKYFYGCKDSGELQAKLAWKRCSIVDDINGAIKHLTNLVKRNQISNDKMLKLIDVCVSDELLDMVKNFGRDITSEAIESYERHIEIRHRPHGVSLNSDMIYNLLNIPIPDDVLIGLSFGPKFLFPFHMNEKNSHRLMALLECTIDKAVPPYKQDLTAQQVCSVLKNRRGIIQDPKNKWLSLIKMRTDRFLINNPDVVALRSDKGNHTVVMHFEEYKQKVRQHLADPAYAVLHSNPLHDLIKSETQIIEHLAANAKTKSLVTNFQPNTLFLPRFYGVIKIHKDFKIRPITATSGAVGNLSNKTANTIIASIFDRQKHHIRDSFDFKKRIDKVVLDPNDTIVSMDIISMYTTIPTDLAIQIVMSKADLFQTKFGLSAVFLQKLLDFVLSDCAVFVFDGIFYRQTTGLPMGGCVSPLIASLVMDHILGSFYSVFPETPKFVGIFVDDSIFIISSDLADIALEILNNCVPDRIKFTMERLNSDCINFLNLTLIRSDTKIITNWFRKPYASDRLLNYMSNHKGSIIEATAKSFIKTVLLLSDGSFFNDNKHLVERRLRLNNFPESVISTLIAQHYTYMRPYSNRKSHSHVFYRSIDSESDSDDDVNFPITNTNSYTSFPHAICHSSKIKSVLNEHKFPDTVLADSVKNTKLNNIKNLKDKLPIADKTNVVVISNCKCGLKYRVDITKFNETGRLVAKRITNTLPRCLLNNHAFSQVKYMNGMAFSSQNKYLLKYIRFKYIGKLDDVQLNLPNVHFCKLLKSM